MPKRVNLTTKEAAFALSIALGKTQIEAARDAKLANPEANANRLMVREGVKLAIEHNRKVLAEAGAIEHPMTPEWIVNNARDLASQRKDLGPAVSATRLLADVHGMTQGQQGALPEGLDTFLGALGESIRSRTATHAPEDAVGMARAREQIEDAEVRELPAPDENE